MKILLVISKFLPEYSGPAFRILNTYKRILKKKNIELKIICQSEEYSSYKEYIYEEFNVIRFTSLNNILFKKFIKQFYFFYLVIRLYFLSNQFDIFHVVGNSQLTTASLYVSRFRKKPLYYELVNASSKPNQRNKILDLFFKLNLKKNCVVSCLSEHLAKKCYDINLFNNVWVRPNPVNLNIFNLRFKKKTNFNLLYISQFIPRKNQIFLIEVMKYLPKNFTLTLAGPMSKKGKNFLRDAEYFNSIIAKVEKYNLNKNIKIIPNFVKTEELINKTTIYLMPSKNEGLGTTLLESLACGVPVIANKNEKVFNEYIINDLNGKLLDLDPKLWAKEIINFDISKYDENKISKQIISKVSSDEIDNKTLKLMEYLIKSNYEEIINVNHVLK